MCVKIAKCRICGNTDFYPVLDLGNLELTGYFPDDLNKDIESGPVRLVKCWGEGACGLVQLEHTFDLDQLYGMNYGYRSGLNESMVRHLHSHVKKILEIVNIKSGDIILDIGSNDSTLLRAYPMMDLIRVGIDPSGIKFKKYYPDDVRLLTEYFTAQLFNDYFPGKKARVVTSFSMLYDLEDPMSFVRDIHSILADDGVWMFEQSYLPTMLEKVSYDTVCQEHLEYYSMKQIIWMMDKVGFVIKNVELNDINGGSFCVTAMKSVRGDIHCSAARKLLEQEDRDGLHSKQPYDLFAKNVSEVKSELLEFLSQAKNVGKTVCALGASTKGNVILQYCGITPGDVKFIGEVNSDKYGCYTPGTNIPIVPEDVLLEMKPDYLLILPWHFKEYFIKSAKLKGYNLVFPLPRLEIKSL